MSLKNWIKKGEDWYVHKHKVPRMEAWVSRSRAANANWYIVWLDMGWDGGVGEQVSGHTSKKEAHESLMKIIRRY